MLMRAFQNQNADLKRGLGLLLLIFIVYGTTVEAAHRHGRVATATQNAAAFEQTGTTTTTPATQSGCSDCLICQLHQSFNTTLVTFRVAEPPTQQTVVLTTALPRDVFSQISGPIAGRAPPSIS